MITGLCCTIVHTRSVAMADFNSSFELQIMSNKLQLFGQYRWVNLVLPTWEEAYTTAYDNVFSRTKSRPGLSLLSLLTSIAGPIIGAEAVAVQIAFAPILWALGRYVPVGDAKLVAPAADASQPRKFILSKRIQFGKMLERVSTAIDKLQSRAWTVNEEEFDRFRSLCLRSPIWYPPANLDVNDLAARIEMRIWAKLYDSGQMGRGED